MTIIPSPSANKSSVGPADVKKEEIKANHTPIKKVEETGEPAKDTESHLG